MLRQLMSYLNLLAYPRLAVLWEAMFGYATIVAATPYAVRVLQYPPPRERFKVYDADGTCAAVLPSGGPVWVPVERLHEALNGAKITRTAIPVDLLPLEVRP